MARAIGRAALLLGIVAASPAEAAPQLDYSYKTPARANAFAPLKAWFAADAKATRAKFDRGVARERAAAKKDKYIFNGWGATREWKVVAETPRFLSLSLDGWDYYNGAHGNPWFGALLYDKVTKQRLKPIDLFASPSALSQSIRADFCRLLDLERTKRRGEPVVRDKGMFDDCIDPAKEVVILGSRSGRAFDRIGILVPPYEAGSYAEGSYDITLPVTPALLATVKPAYRSTFAVAR